MAYGVRKVNEYIVKDGRALIMTQDVASGISQAQWDSIGDGTVYISPSDGTLQYKKRGNEIKEWSKFEPINIFYPGSIEGRMLVNKTLTNGLLADNAVNSRVLDYNSVSGPIIQNQAIVDRHFASNSLSGFVLKDNSISGEKISELNGAKLIKNTISGDAIKANTIDNRAIKFNSITNQLLAANSVDNRVVKPNSLSGSLLCDNTIESRSYKEGSVDHRALKSNSVDYDIIKNGAVRETAFSNESVSNRALAQNCVSTQKIEDRAITNVKIGLNEIKNENIKDSELEISKFSEEVKNKISNAVVIEDGIARVRGVLQVDSDIKSTSGNQSYSITGFKVYNPLFADYAEGFVTTEPVYVGDIVEIDRHTCVKKASASSSKIVGVVSEQYGLCLDASKEDIESGAKVAVGLIGKVPVNVIGTIEAGDFIVSCGNGVGVRSKQYVPGAVVGKALETKEDYEIGKVLCLINVM